MIDKITSRNKLKCMTCKKSDFCSDIQMKKQPMTQLYEYSYICKNFGMHIIYFTSCHFFIFLRCHFNTTTTKMFSNIHKQRTQLYPKIWI